MLNELMYPKRMPVREHNEEKKKRKERKKSESAVYLLKNMLDQWATEQNRRKELVVTDAPTLTQA